MGVEALRSAAGVVDRSNRGKLHFKGGQAVWFLDQLVTGRLEGLEAGRGCDALLLTPKGRIVAPMRLLVTGKSVFSDVDPQTAAGLKGFFDQRVFTTEVEIVDRTSDFGLFTVLGREADDVVANALGEVVASESEEHRDLGAEIPSEAEHHTTHFGSTALVRVTRPVRGLDVWVRTEMAAEMKQALLDAGTVPATQPDYGELCTIEGVPRFGIDYDDGYLPQEAALERAVHFSKGCYLGQEAVAMTQRGRVKRRLRHLRFDGPSIIGSLRYEGAEAGAIGSAADESGSGFAIASVKTSVPVGTDLQVVSEYGDVSTATVLELPGTVEGPKVPSARELRERLEG